MSVGGSSTALAQDDPSARADRTDSPVINYQGRLTDDQGQPVTDSNHTLVFNLYEQASGGTPIWKETQNVETSDGVFSAELGSINDLSALSFEKTYYLGIEVDGGNELSPRTRLADAPYAIRARSVEDAAITDAALAGGAVTTGKIAAGAVTMAKIDQAGAGSGEVLKWNGSAWAPSPDETGTGSGAVWTTSGNAGTTPGTDFLGTTDATDLVMKVDDQEVFRLTPDDTTASVSTGHPDNRIGAGLSGSVIAGGGYSNSPNEVTNSWSTVSGGLGNSVSGILSVVSGGWNNTASGEESVVSGGQDGIASGGNSTIGGGASNTTSGNTATVAGGYDNSASGLESTIGGGDGNRATDNNATVAGGWNNRAAGGSSTVGGGRQNTASGDWATVPGGRYNAARASYSFAAGSYAKANHEGSFVWSGYSTFDSTATTGPNQFLVQAAGGVGIGTEDPANQFHVRGSAGGSAYTMGGHVASIENEATSSADVLALKIAEGGDPGTDANFLSFIDGDGDLLGEIQANGSGGIEYASSGADFAEMLPVRDPAVAVEAGDVVGVRGGTVGLETNGADRVMVITGRPALVGNTRGETTSTSAERVPVSFVGQVDVRVRGPAGTGDLLVPSGREDGTARAVSPGSYDPAGHGPVLGQAWETRTGPGVSRVRTVIGSGSQRVIEALASAFRTRIREETARRDRQREALRTQRILLERQSARIDRLERQVRALLETRATQVQSAGERGSGDRVAGTGVGDR